MKIGQKFLQRVLELAQDNQVISYINQETKVNHLLIPYDNDRHLQFGKVVNNKFEYEQHFMAKYKVNNDSTKLIGLKDLPFDVFSEELELVY